MSVDEYAAFEKATTEEHLVHKGGFWWRRVRHGFYRPLTPFLPELSPNARPSGSMVQYGLIDSSRANSILNLIIFDSTHLYCLDHLSKKIRNHLKVAVNHGLYVKQITDPRIILDQAYDVYKSFVFRTGYTYDQKRIIADFFQKWFLSLKRFPKSKLHGIFYREYLLAYQVSVLVNDVLVLKPIISSNTGLHLHSSDLLLHYYRKLAYKQDNIRMIYDGYYSVHHAENHHKLLRGAIVWCLPARIDAPFSLLMMARILRPLQYKYLIGFTNFEITDEYF